MTTRITEKETDIEIRSDDIQEIMSHIPNWMIRYGISLIFILFAIAGLITWFIKYPDIISGRSQITTESSNTRIVAKSSGEIVFLLPEGVEVKKGEKVAAIKSTLSSSSRETLVKTLDTVEAVLNDNQLNISFNDNHQTFGTLQNEYLEFKKTVLDYQFFLSTNSVEFEISTITNQIKNHRSLKSVTSQQIKDYLVILDQANNRYNSALVLYENNAIAKTYLYDTKERFTSVKTKISDLKKASIQTSITIIELEKQLHELQQKFSFKKNEFLRIIQVQIASLRNRINEWKSMYELRASHSGKLAYLQDLSINQYIENGTELIAIIPKNEDFIGRLTVSSIGYGKVKRGQRIKVTLDNYPAHEFGQLEGKVTNISLISRSNNYRVEFKLINGMKSTHGVFFEYLPEMSGKADIVTEDLRLVERFFNNFKVLFE